MGNATCELNCNTKIIEHFDFPNDESVPQRDISGLVIKIQSLFRKFMSRKLLKNLLIAKLQKKRHIISSSISFKESWELHFKSQSNFEFSPEGLKQLEAKLELFYLKFFTIDNLSKSIISLSSLKTFGNGELFKDEFKKWILVHMKRQFYLGTVDDHIFLNEITVEGIEKPIESPKIQHSHSLGGQVKRKEFTHKDSLRFSNNSPKKLIENILKMKFSSKKSAPFNDKFRRDAHQKLTNQPKEINTKGFFQLLAIKAMEKQKIEKGKIILYDVMTNQIYFKKLLQEIKVLQNKLCESISFQDPVTKLIYSGGFNQITHCKDGIGSEYMIENNTVNGIYKYIGSYSNNKYHGIGMLIKESGEMYFGEWRNGYQNGLGYHFTNNSQYVGFFKDNLYEGYGELSIKDKFSYYGTWKSGKQTGIGFYESNIKSTYCGEFVKGKINGTGCFKWKDGQRYLGTWNNDLMDGFGKYNYTNGDKFVGFYKNDLKHGKGIYSFDNGMKLEGKWVKGKKEGDFYLTSPVNSLNMLIKYEDDIQLNR